MLKIKKRQNKQGTWDVYVNGDWTLTGTEAEADQEIRDREQAYKYWLERNPGRARPGEFSEGGV